MRTAALAAIAAFVVLPALADDPVIRTVEDSFENVAFAVESAIVGEGLVIDYVSHVGEMLERTRADVGSDVQLFTQADIFVFCSATVSRQVMEADPMNLQHCPYGIFVAERADSPGTVMVAVEALLEGIVTAALGAD